MKIIWINTATTKTISNTRLFGIPSVLNKWGDQNWVVIGDEGGAKFPDYFIILPIPFGRIRLYRFLVAISLPFICLRYKPDIIITDYISSSLTQLLVLLRRVGLSQCKLVHDVRTVPVREDGGKTDRIYSRSMSYARRNFDGITTISERLRKIICDRFNLSPDAVGVWPSGVDANHFRPRANPEMRKELGLEDKFIVFYHGAVNENRGVIELAEAAQFLDDLPDLRILIVGAGHLWDTLKKVVQKKRLDKVILIPAVPYSQIPDWVAMADLCAIPLPDHLWWHVSSPLKLMEYLSMGKPILLTDIIPHRAIIPDDEDAFYVHESEGEGFAKGIRRAMAERERFSEMRRKGRAKAASELTWEIQAKKLKNYLELVLDNQINRIRPKNI